jgi:hypothetical protein
MNNKERCNMTRTIKKTALSCLVVFVCFAPVTSCGGNGEAGENRRDADTQKEPFAAAEANAASTCVRLGERLSEYAYSYESDGETISKKQATDLAMAMLVAEGYNFKEKTLLTYDSHYGDDYYGYRLNEWTETIAEGAVKESERLISERLARIRPGGDAPVDGIYYPIEFYKQINDIFGTRMQVMQSIRVIPGSGVLMLYDLFDTDAVNEFVAYAKVGSGPPGSNAEGSVGASTYVRLGERLSEYAYSYESDGETISAEQATDLAMFMILSESPDVKERTLLIYDDFYGDGYYGYQLNEWIETMGGSGMEENTMYDSIRLSCARPGGNDLMDGKYYEAVLYEYINDDFGVRMPVSMSIAVLAREKVLVKDVWGTNEEAIAELDAYLN